MIVDRITLRELRLQLREPFRISSGMVSERRIFLLEMVDADSGTSEWSECVAGEWPNYTAETVDTAWWAITTWLAPKLLGRTIDDAGQVRALLDADVKGHAMAKAALEMGCWALAAKIAGVPLSRHLGGTRDRVVTGISLGIQDTPAALVTRAVAARDAGYRKIKLKIAPGRDVAYVAAVRQALGDEAHIMVDANTAYTLSDADHLVALDAFDLIMIEQPLGSDDLVRHAALQRRLTTPICLDESITDLDRAADMITLGAGRIVNIKPGRVGGFSAARAIHDHCARHGVPVWCGGMLESGVGRAHNVALASLPNFLLPGDLSPSARYWAQDIVEPEWTMDGEGMVRVPLDRAGIGVTVAVDRVDALTVRCEVLRAP
ncbi:MAG TPA: o-succinylbenzoate synthase [Gemmatimonadaceae bacterium]|jgi:O-succinylbenzoate synthase|nr:o-succinylbenzoate synthase [Gemmatimonadaceae bacterium]